MMKAGAVTVCGLVFMEAVVPQPTQRTAMIHIARTVRREFVFEDKWGMVHFAFCGASRFVRTRVAWRICHSVRRATCSFEVRTGGGVRPVRDVPSSADRGGLWPMARSFAESALGTSGPLHLRTRWVVVSCAGLEINVWGMRLFCGVVRRGGWDLADG